MELSCHKSEEFFIALSTPPTMLPPSLAIYYSAVNQLGSSSSLCNTADTAQVYGKRDGSLVLLYVCKCACVVSRVTNLYTS